MLDELWYLISNWLSNWIPLLSVILFPSLLLMAVWRLWSHSGEFELTWREKLLRVAILVGIVVLVALLLDFFVEPDKPGFVV